MTGRCSRCKEMCEAELWEIWTDDGHKVEWRSNCCDKPLIEDGERSHDEG